MRSVDELRLGQLDGEFASEALMPDEAERRAAINDEAKAFARTVIENVPWSVDRDHAVRLIREAAMWARDALRTHKAAVAEEIETTCGHKLTMLPVESVD